METAISDLAVYLSRMQKSVLDKMFFFDKVFDPFDYVLDFGCANGELIKALHILFGGDGYVGYDISPEMIAAARENVPEAEFYERWEEIPIPFDRTLFNISSTLHEVYSYGTQADVELFWQRVFGSGFRYICVRDMMVSRETEGPADPEQLRIVRDNKTYARQLKDYEAVWGPITTQKSLVHFLLKYRYTQNWEREVRENYLPLPLEDLMAKIPPNYKVVWMDHYTLPYTAWQIHGDYGFHLQTPTHLKLILKRVDEA